MDGGGAPVWHPLWYVVGAVLAGMIGVALGGSFVKERGRRVLPVVVVCTLASAVILGWALDMVLSTFYASAMH